jgi:polyhydroxybutyrate depolymerase
MDRLYLLFVPDGYDPSVAHALVVNMHGFTSNAGQQVVFSDMNSTAGREVFVVAYPDGYHNSWNAGVCCGDAVAEDVDDVGFLVAVVDDVASRLCIDRRRVFAAGMSNGGYMSHRLACEASDTFAAVAPVAAGLGILGCSPSRPVPVLAFHGTDDSYVDLSAAEAALASWVDMDACTDGAERTMFATSWCDMHDECDAGVQVGLCVLDGMDHCWPGGPAPRPICEMFVGDYSEDINANDHMWEFFSHHPLPE